MTPRPQLTGMASVPGWDGPLQVPVLDKDVAEQVLQLSLNQWDQHAYFNYTDDNSPGGKQWTFNGPMITEAYGGIQGRLHVTVANVETFVSPTAVADANNGRTYLTGAIVVELPVAVPYMSVLRPIRSLFGGHGWRSGNKKFDAQFQVRFLKKKDDRAAEVLLPLVPLIAVRDDWAFTLMGPHLICVTHTPFVSTPEVQRTLDQINQMVSQVGQPTGSSAPQVLPPTQPGHADDPRAFEDQLAGLTPEQQAALIVSSGHDPPAVTEEQLAEAIRRDQK